MTHWKKIVSDPNYLGEADFEPGQEIILTIDSVNADETIMTNEGKSHKAVVHWKEPMKPMILNVVRSKAITKVAGSPYFENWSGVRVQLYIDPNVKAFGEIVAAVRVRPQKPIEKKLVLCEDCGQPIQGASGRSADYIAAYTHKKFGACLCFGCAGKRGSDNGKTEAE